VLPSHVLVLFCLLFWFRMFSSCCLDGMSKIRSHAPMLCHAGREWDEYEKIRQLRPLSEKAESSSVADLVRLPGFEPGYSAWEADVLPS
jgi:hypothetical protein